ADFVSILQAIRLADRASTVEFRVYRRGVGFQTASRRRLNIHSNSLPTRVRQDGWDCMIHPPFAGTAKVTRLCQKKLPRMVTKLNPTCAIMGEMWPSSTSNGRASQF